MVVADESFVAHVADAYEHLYDTVYLRTHFLTRLVPADERQSSKDVAWRLHHLLLDVIDELDPGPDAPAFSREWRRHRLMVLRYGDGLRPQEVADRLAISERSYYRELRDAIEAVAALLAERQPGTKAEPERQGGREEAVPLDRMSLLRVEAARLASEERQAALGTVVANAVALVENVCREQGITVHAALGESAANVAVNRNAVRQVLLSTLSHIIQLSSTSGSARPRSITIDAAVGQDGIDILIAAGDGGMPPDARGRNGDDSAQRLAALRELAQTQGIQVLPLDQASCHAERDAWGLCLHLPHKVTHTVLVVDDNDDILQLFERYLAGHTYTMIPARDGAQAIALAKSCLPDAITLDLMMPDQDGWDVLVTLTNQPDTQHIPVIVCSVLSARALALSLGASVFLEKPVSEQSLLSALATLGL